MHFADLDAYLRHFEQSGGPALLPEATAAWYLGVSGPTVTRMSKDGRLDGVDIEGDRFIVVDSYIAFQKRSDDRVATVRSICETAACERRVITYSDVMSPVGLRWQSPPDRKSIGYILGEISTATYNAHGVFLTAIVHKKYGAGTRPGAGYFALVNTITGEDLGGDEEEATRKAVEKVFKFYSEKRDSNR